MLSASDILKVDNLTKYFGGLAAVSNCSLKIKKGYSGLSPVFIVGMPRSGTTLVEQIISSHSEVTGAGELNYIAQYGSKLSINSTSSTTLTLSDFRKKYLFE